MRERLSSENRRYVTFSPSLFITLILLSQAVYCQQPDQFHISLSGKSNEMVIEFVTHKDEEAYCMYATDASILIAPSTPDPPVTSNYTGYYVGQGYLIDGYDLYAANMTINDAVHWCTGNSSCQGMTFQNSDQFCGGKSCYVYFKTGLQYAPDPSSWTTLYKPPLPIPNQTSSLKIEYMNETLGAVGWLNTVVLRNLEINTQYFYTCGSGANDWSSLKWFTNSQTEGSWIFAIFADFGYVNDESVNSLYADVEANAFDIVILAGDQAYDLDSNGGETGNSFMRMQEGYASHSRMLEIPPHFLIGRVGRLYNSIVDYHTTIFDPICHRDIRPLEPLFRCNHFLLLITNCCAKLPDFSLSVPFSRPVEHVGLHVICHLLVSLSVLVKHRPRRCVELRNRSCVPGNNLLLLSQGRKSRSNVL